MGMSTAMKNSILNLFFNKTAYTPPTNLYIALYVGDPDGAGSEVSGNNYARVNHNAWNTAAAGSISNDGVIQFPVPSGSWGTVTHFAVFDALTAGTMHWSGSLSAIQSIGENNDVKYDDQALTASIS